MSNEETARLFLSLLREPRETPWLEFKRNNTNDAVIGEYVSALANSAALHQRNEGFLVWGVDDTSRQPVGTDFDIEKARIGGQPLLIHLASQLQPSVQIRVVEGIVDTRRLVAIRVPPAETAPIAYKGTRYIRIGESKTELQGRPEERELFARLDKTPFEIRAARTRLDESEVLPLIDYPAYFDLLRQPLPENRSAILKNLEVDRLIRKDVDGWTITNLGALLFAKALAQFDSVARKAVRAVVYKREDRAEILRQHAGVFGYASGFNGLIQWITAQVPDNTHIGAALRTEIPMYPAIAIREVVANALIHQDLAIGGAGPVIEIFPNRMEVLNPGQPVTDPSRLDLPPRSRNEMVAGLMRRMGMCEELGSGIDRVLGAVETFQLPAPDFQVPGDSTRVTLFAHRTFARMDRKERMRAAYQHAGLLYITDRRMTNATLRKRFGIEDDEYTKVSGVIRDALDAKFIFHDPPQSSARKTAKYVPFWASPAWNPSSQEMASDPM